MRHAPCPPSVSQQEMSIARMRDIQGRSHEDPLQETSALQYLSSEAHPNVLQCVEVRVDVDEEEDLPAVNVADCGGVPTNSSASGSHCRYVQGHSDEQYRNVSRDKYRWVVLIHAPLYSPPHSNI